MHKTGQFLSENASRDNGQPHRHDDDKIVRTDDGSLNELDPGSEPPSTSSDRFASDGRETHHIAEGISEETIANENSAEKPAAFEKKLREDDELWGENAIEQGPDNEKLVSVKEPIKIEPPKCDKDIFNPFGKNLNRFDKIPEVKRCVLGGTMTYVHRGDRSDTIVSSKNTAKHAMNYKKTYLFLYNLTMFVMFLMVDMILCIKALAGKMDDESIQGAAFIIRLLTYTQLLECIHPMVGLVPGRPLMPFLQVLGRIVINNFLSEPAIRMNSDPHAYCLFIVWSSIELFRYSFYALGVFGVQIYPITYARYTLFMPLYPMGGFYEANIVMAAVEHYEKSGAYSISLPNSANFSFSLPGLLRFYTIAILPPSILYLMRYMYSQRRKHLKDKIE